MDEQYPDLDYAEASDWALPRLNGPQFRRLVARHWTLLLSHDDWMSLPVLPMQQGGDA